MKRLILGGLLALLALPAAAQQVLEHPSQVTVKPPSADRTGDAFRVWGGIKAGPLGETVIVDANGVIQGVGIPDKSIDFIKFAGNSCSVDEIPVFTGSGEGQWFQCQKVLFGNLGMSTCSSGQVIKYNGSSWDCGNDNNDGSGAPLGVSSVGLSLPGIFSVSGSPVTTTGTLTATFVSQNQNLVFASPDGTSGTPTFRALVVGDLPGTVLTPSSNPTITGSWRFSTNTVFGEAVTPAQLIHVYRDSTDAGIRLQRGVDAWDLVAGDQQFRLVDVGGLTPLRITPETVGIFTLAPNSSYALDVTGAARISGNLTVGGYLPFSPIPAVSDTYSLGDPSKRWLGAWISNIYATVFAEETVQLLGGYFMVTKNAGTFGTDVGASASTIDFGKTLTGLPLWILVRGKNTSGTYTAEYLRIDSLVSGTTYNVVRDIQPGLPNGDGVGQPWAEGQPYAVLGQMGDGRIELTAYGGLPRIGMFRQGSTAQAADELVRIGSLDGMPGMSSLPGRYGIYIGDATNFLKYYDGALTVGGTVQATAGYFGTSGNIVSITASGLDVGNTGSIRTAGATYANTTGGVWMGADSGTYKFRIGDGTKSIKWDGSALTITGANVTVAGGNILVTGGAAADVNAGGTTISGTKITADSIESAQIKAGTIVASDIASGTITATQITSDFVTANVLRSSSATALDSGTGFYISGAGNSSFRFGNPAGNRIRWDGSSLTIQAGNVSLGPSGLSLPGSGGWDPVNNLAIGDIGFWASPSGPSLTLLRTNGGSFGSFTVAASYSYISGVTMDDGRIYPQSSGKSLGTGSNRWGDLFLNGVIYLDGLDNTTSGDTPVVWSPGNRRFYGASGLHTGTCPAGVNVRNGLVESCS